MSGKIKSRRKVRQGAAIWFLETRNDNCTRRSIRTSDEKSNVFVVTRQISNWLIT